MTTLYFESSMFTFYFVSSKPCLGNPRATFRVNDLRIQQFNALGLAMSYCLGVSLGQMQSLMMGVWMDEWMDGLMMTEGVNE